MTQEQIPHGGVGDPDPAAGPWGTVELCKQSNVGGTFKFDISGTAALLVNSPLDIVIGDGGGTECVDVYLSAVGHSTNPAETVIITETTADNLTAINIVQYLQIFGNLPGAYREDELNDTPDPYQAGDVTASLRINDDMARRVTFVNFTPDEPPPADVCDFITFGRLVTTIGGEKVVISGNAGGNNMDGSIKNEFHIEYLGVDYHVADATSYGPIDLGPLSDETLFPNARVVTGIAKNGAAIELRVWDGGEPGKDTDKVWFSINGSVKTTGADGQFIDQGNMQYHSTCRGPDPKDEVTTSKKK